MFKKVLQYLLSISLIIGVIICQSYYTIPTLSTIWKITLMSVSVILFILSIIFRWTNLKVLYKIFFVFFILYSMIVIAYTIMYKYDLLYVFSSVNNLKNYILSTGEKGVLVYIIVQFLQVVFLPIPASVICIVGSLIYGPFLGGLYCCIGVLAGSYISFILGKVFGYRLVSWIVGKANTDKYSEIIRKRGGFFLGLAFLLPMFPDDILCFIAGISNMSSKSFFWITLITRPIGVICMAFFGSGYVIPFSGWGVYAWIGILIVAVAMIVVVYRYQENLETYILNKISNKTKSSKHNKN